LGSGGTEFDPADSYSSARFNQKSTFVGTGAQINALSTTYPGMHAYCTSTGSGFIIDIEYVRNAANSAWNAIDFFESAEANNTAVTDNADFTVTAGRKYYAFFTLPSTEKLYVFTKILWKNGATLNGNIIAGVDMIDADPPTLANTILIAHCPELAQAGVSQDQSTTQIVSKPVRGGTICGVWVSSSSNTATLREQTGLGSQNQLKASAYDTTPDSADTTAWTTATARKKVVAYYRGYY